MSNNRIPRFVRLTLPYIFLSVVLVAAAIYISNNLEQFRKLEISSWWWLAALFISFIGQSFSGAMFFKRLLGIFQIRINLWEALGLVFITGIGNYLIPYVGGMGLRATYLKKKYGFPLSYFVGMVGGTALITISVNALLGLIGVACLLAVKGIFSIPIFLLFLCFVFLPSLLYYSLVRNIKFKNRFGNKLNNICEGWRAITRRPGDIIVLSSLSLLAASFGILILYISFRVLNHNIFISDAIIISSLTALSALVSITPAGLGITEIFIVLSSQALGYMLVISVSVALITRIVSAVIIFIGGGIASYMLSISLFQHKSRISNNIE